MSGYYAKFSGVTAKNKTIALVLSGILVVLGVAAIILAFTLTVSGGMTSHSTNESVVINGVLYENVNRIERVKEPLPDELKVLLVVFGLVLISSAASSIVSLITINRSYVELTDMGVTGAQYSSIFFIPQVNRFNFYYSQIQTVQVPDPSAVTPTLNIMAYNQCYSVKIADAQQVAMIIRNVIGR